MALIMFSGMFGFGEMVSYISFMGDGGGGCWCGCLLTAGSATLKNFTFLVGSLNYACWLILLHTAIWNFTYLLCLLLYGFYLWHNHKTFECDGILRGLPIFALTCLLQNSYFQTSCATHRFAGFSCQLYCTVYFQVKSHSPAFIRIQWMFVCSGIMLIMWLCCGAETPGGEVFVRSFVSHYPEGFSAPYFFCSKSPGYTSVISLLPFPPSQLKDTVGID